MKDLGLMLLAIIVATAAVWGLLYAYHEYGLAPDGKPGDMGFIPADMELVTVNTTRIGSDNPIETAVSVSHMVYPATESENTPGAVILVNINNMAEAFAAGSRVQHFPVNAPVLYVDDDVMPELTRNELLRLKPEGVAVDGNTQVYLVGTMGASILAEVEAMGYRARVLTAPDPILLTEVLDKWSSTQHGDHVNDVVIVNLDRLDVGVPSYFWNAHMGDGLAFVTDEGVPEATRRILERRYSGPWIYVFGDETVISERTTRDLAQYGHVTRIKAGNPPDASSFFAAFKDQGKDWGAWIIQTPRLFGWGIGEAGHNAIIVRLDGPGGWQNALPGATLSHMGKHGPVIILEGGEIPDSVRAYLQTTQPYPTAPQQQLLNHGMIIGGPETISWEIQAELDLLLEGQLEAADVLTQQGS